MDVAFSETGAVSHCMVMKLPDCQGPSAQPGAQTPRARKSRAASVGMTFSYLSRMLMQRE